MMTWTLIAFVGAYFIFAFFKALTAIKRVKNSRAPVGAKIFLTIVAIMTCLIPTLLGEAESLIEDHLKMKGWL